jgi:hypothetical protein
MDTHVLSSTSLVVSGAAGVGNRRLRRCQGRHQTTALNPSERRMLGGVLGFLAGLAALGPVAALAAALLGVVAARFADSR